MCLSTNRLRYQGFSLSAVSPCHFRRVQIQRPRSDAREGVDSTLPRHSSKITGVSECLRVQPLLDGPRRASSIFRGVRVFDLCRNDFRNDSLSIRRCAGRWLLTSATPQAPRYLRCDAHPAPRSTDSFPTARPLHETLPLQVPSALHHRAAHPVHPGERADGRSRPPRKGGEHHPAQPVHRRCNTGRWIHGYLYTCRNAYPNRPKRPGFCHQRRHKGILEGYRGHGRRNTPFLHD
jgi:hypothetical protein